MNDQRARARLRRPPAFVPFSLAGGAATLHGRFEEQAARRPDAPAVVLALIPLVNGLQKYLFDRDSCLLTTRVNASSAALRVGGQSLSAAFA